MELTQGQYELIEPHLPVQRGNVRIPNLQVLNAILYVAEHGCKWRGLPERFGRWHTVYMRMNRWSKNGVLDRVFDGVSAGQLQQQAGRNSGGQSRCALAGQYDGQGASGRDWRRVEKNGDAWPKTATNWWARECTCTETTQSHSGRVRVWSGPGSTRWMG